MNASNSTDTSNATRNTANRTKKITAGRILSIISIVAGIVALIVGAVSGSAGTVVAVCLIIAILCNVVYVLISRKAADILNLVSVILIAVALSEYIIGSIATFADALNGITMFGSGGGIQAVIAGIASIAVALIAGIVSCFMRR